MQAILGGISGIFGIVGLVCWIVTIIRAFKTDGVMWGLLSLCSPIGFFWGWKNAGRLDAAAAAKGEKPTLTAKNTMIAWTVAFIVGVVLNRVGAGG